MGTNDVIPISVSGIVPGDFDDEHYITIGFHDANNSPSEFLNDTSWYEEDGTLEEFLIKTFGSTLANKVTIVSQGKDYRESRKDYSQWWSPALPDRRGNVPQ